MDYSVTSKNKTSYTGSQSAQSNSVDKPKGADYIPMVDSASEQPTHEAPAQSPAKSNLPPVVVDFQKQVMKLIAEKNINASAEDVYECINSLVMSHGINLRDFAKDFTSEKADKILEAIKTAIEQLEGCNKELTLESITTTMMINHAGFTRNEYETALSNGEAKSIREELGLAEGEELTAKAVRDYMQNFVHEAAKKVQSGEIKPEEFVNTIKKKVAFLMAATPEEDKKFLDTILHSLKNDKANLTVPVAKILLYGRSIDKQKALCEKFRLEFNDIIKDNGMIDKNDVLEFARLLDSRFSSEEILEQYKATSEECKKYCETQEVQEFIRKNGKASDFLAREDVKAVLAKNPEDLTPEDKELAKEIEIAQTLLGYTGQGASGLMTAVERGDNKIAQEINYYNYQLVINNDINTSIKDYVAAHYEEMGTTVEEFARKMDAVTNGNYSLICENPDIAKSDLNLPHDPNATSNADLGYTTRGTGRTANVESLTAQIVAQSRVEDQNFEIVKNDNNSDTKKAYTRAELSKFSLAQFAQQGHEAIKYYIDEFGVEQFIKDAISSSNVGENVINKAKNLYTKTYDANRQGEMAQNAGSYKVGATLLSWMSDAAKKRLDKMGSFALTKELKNEQDEAKVS